MCSIQGRSLAQELLQTLEKGDVRMKRSKPLGERLIEAGLITPEQRDIALKEQKKSGELIGAILYSLGFITQKDLQTVLSVSHSGNAGKQAEQDLVLPADIEEIVQQSTATLRKAGETTDKVSDISLAPIVRLIEKIIIIGIQKGATDIHIGPDGKKTSSW
jgi:type IV pilus assembly protein PilB